MVIWGDLVLKVFGRSKKFLSIEEICKELSSTPYVLGKMNKKVVLSVLNDNCSDSELWKGKQDLFQRVEVDEEKFWRRRRLKEYENNSLNFNIHRSNNLEGSMKRYFHKIRERNKYIVQDKIKSVINELGRLDCEVCNFNFEDFYGKNGHLFIECHHKIPLSTLKPSTVTRLEDLAIVCSNCHRMLHRKPYPSVKKLKKQILNL
ncbi:HNH endonuclease [Gammaproteobacteria bacterium]|nr:HNH endonuclease [Gammaproteobacteria bacterium]